MIKLDVCEYCQDCLEFEPYVDQRPDLYYSNEEQCLFGDTVVKCENQCKCKVLYNHLKKENNDGISFEKFMSVKFQEDKK